MMENKTKHLCKECGQTDSIKFKKRCISTCSKCFDIKYRRQKGVVERVIKAYCCTECGESDPAKFKERMKSKCLTCKGKLYYKKRKKHIIKITAEYKRKKIKEDPSFKLIKNLRDRQRSVLLGNVSTTKSLGCDRKTLRDHMESLWESWMTWNNYGNREGQWSMDHILPLSSYVKNSNGEWDQYSEYNKQLLHYTNLRPLLQLENSIKGAKII